MQRKLCISANSLPNVFFGSAIVGTKVAFTSPRVIGGIDPGSSFVPPSSTVKLGHFSTVMLTTYSGFHGSLSGWYQHAKMIVTSDGTMIGAALRLADRAGPRPVSRN